MAKEKSIPVTSLKSLKHEKGDGEKPTFNLPVIVKTLTGDELVINYDAKAYRKSEWAALRDDYRKKLLEGDTAAQDAATDADAEDKPAEKADFSFEDLVNKGMHQAAEMVLLFAAGWGLEDEFNVASLVELEDTVGGTLAATLSAYDAALFNGRVGN